MSLHGPNVTKTNPDTVLALSTKFVLGIARVERAEPRELFTFDDEPNLIEIVFNDYRFSQPVGSTAYQIWTRAGNCVGAAVYERADPEQQRRRDTQYATWRKKVVVHTILYHDFDSGLFTREVEEKIWDDAYDDFFMLQGGAVPYLRQRCIEIYQSKKEVVHEPA